MAYHTRPTSKFITVKLLNNFSNNKLYDPYGFKEEVKIRYNSVKAITKNFPNGTAAMMTLLAAKAPPLDWAAYYALASNKQLVWEQRSDELNKSMLYLMDSKNKLAKKVFRLVYSQRNMIAYPTC